MNIYLWLKAFHLIALIAWFAGIFYLPRLFVYHAAAQDQISKERFKIMEIKLLRIIMNPAMVLTIVLGIWLLVVNWVALSGQTWIWIKILLVLGLVGYQHFCLKITKAFARDETPYSEKFFRIFNEIPVFILVSVVLLAILKPF